MIRLEDGVKSEGKEKSVLLIAFQCCLIRLCYVVVMPNPIYMNVYRRLSAFANYAKGSVLILG